jgi:hypothetical protein
MPSANKCARSTFLFVCLMCDPLQRILDPANTKISSSVPEAYTIVYSEPIIGTIGAGDLQVSSGATLS